MMRRILVLTAVVGFAAAVFTRTFVLGQQSTTRFSHKLHIEEVGAECLDCHMNATTATYLSHNILPPLEVCAGCHEQDVIDASGYNRRAEIESPWIFEFSHQLHLGLEGVDCQKCHGGIQTAQQIPSGHLPEMALCIDCHHSRDVSDDCTTCHWDVDLRRPESHVADWVLDHVDFARGDQTYCMNCHTETYCEECHNGAALGLAITGEDGAPVDRIGPMASTHKGIDVLILQRSHDLNYRFSHGTDVRAKTSDCSTCHDTRAFCNACHNPEDDANRYRPVWHDLPNFALAEHADHARNDIEICAGCHDQYAAEPSCMQCHRGISGVSPHPLGFMEDVEGSWHDEDDAVCFVCHQNTHLAGQGFCGKCHD